ncbi:MAG TPA: hypothetical protein VM262_18100 [Acidimicrobiales bacterium]|nr:hypothetical protein [Acidimicrobiales bacterium]
MTATLAALLEEVATAPVPIADPGPVIDELRDRLETAATEAVDGLGAEHLPVRLPKARVAELLACEQLAVTASASGRSLSEPVVRGRILDRLLHHHVHGGGPAPGPALAVAVGAFEAERDDEVVAWLDHDPDLRARLAEDASGFAERLQTLGPIDPAWWPRCEDRLRVDLADGAVVCAAQLDLVAGGGPTGRPMVILEAKSGPFTADHRDGLFWYALLAALRHGSPPRGVIGWSAWEGRAWWQPVTADVLRGAATRGEEALARLAALLGGRAPDRTACRACAWCAERPTCPAARPLDGGEDGGGFGDGW